MAPNTNFELAAAALPVEPNPRGVSEPADESDVMREQLEYLIGHATRSNSCGCPDCRRYRQVRALLLAIFTEPETRPAVPGVVLPMAA